MARTSLPPGYRFHPTDAELVMYYLKRKVMGKKFRLESIAEVNIYQFSPWDLPDKSCSKSRDLEWFFFCPTEKKYASGVRVNRATENGFWKTTGKDRSIHNNDKLVGTVKTLIFHLGHAPKGKRTDWVIHEYKILDTQLAAAGMQDTYVLCKVFKKNGPGPKNGAQYGAPFNEADWSDDDDDAAENHAISLASDGPLPTTLLQTEEQSCLPATGLFGPGNKSGLSLIEGQLTSASHPASEVVVDETDDVLMHLIASLTDDDMMLCNENEINQDERSGKGKNLPCADGISKNLGDLNSWSWMNSRTQADENSLKNNPLLVNSAYIELDDFGALLDYPAGLTENGQSSVSGMHMSHMHWNIQQSDPEASSSGVDQYPARTNQFPLLPEGTYDGDNCFDLLQVNSSLNQEGCNASYDLDFVFGRLDNGINSAQDMERGAHRKICFSRLMESIPALSYSCCGGSSIHIKAEVTHGAGECTNEALFVMMGGSSSCGCTQVRLCGIGWYHLLFMLGFSFGMVVVYYIVTLVTLLCVFACFYPFYYNHLLLD